MNKKGVLFLLNIILFFNGFNLCAQTIEKKQALTSILKILSKRYNVRFSYADETIANSMAKLPKTELPLNLAIRELELETHLKFHLLNKRFITIVERKKNQLPILREQFDEIVIKNYLTSGITKLNDGSLTIKPEKFGILPGLIEPDVLQTIQALPGVYSVEESVSNINVRGGTHDQNLILWDGIKMYQSGHFFGLISAFNPYTTKKINVSKNGTKAKFGDGVSSVIDMQLSNTIDGTFTAGVGFNLINAHAYAKIPLSKRTELQVASRRSITDLILTPTYDQYFKRVFQDSDLSNTTQNNNSISQNESFRFHDLSLKFLYDISKKDKLRFHVLNITNTLNYEESLSTTLRNEALNSNLSQKNLAYSISHTRHWRSNLESTAQIYLTNYDLEATNFDIINDQRLIQKNEVFDGTAKLDLNYNLNANLKLNAGYQFTEVGISNLQDVNNPLFRSFIREVVRTNAVYGEVGYLSTNAKTRCHFGTRLNRFNKFDETLIEPRLNFSQRFLNVFRLEILGEFKHQTTSQTIDLQNDFLGIENRRWVLSNNNTETVEQDGKTIFPVPILKSKQASAGIHYAKHRFLISAEVFIKKVDGITTRSQGFQNQFQFVNAIGSYDIKGLDVLVNKQFKNNISAWLGYAYSNNTYLFPSLNAGVRFPNNADTKHALTFASSYTNERLKLSLGFNWRSGRPTTPPTGIQNENDGAITYASPNSRNLEDYMRTDCSATYNFKVSKSTKAILGASIWNIFNTKNTLNTYYTLDDTNTITRIENESLGITPNLSFRLRF